MQAYQISTKQNPVINMLSRNQYTEIVNKYIFLYITTTIFEISLKAGIQKYILSKYQCGLTTSTQKPYIIATNSYTKHCALFGKNTFSAQVGGLKVWIGHLGGRRVKTKTIKGYLAGLQSLSLNCTLDMAKLEIYNHLILQKIIVGLQRLYGEGDTCECQPITFDILLKLISKFDQTTFEGANLYVAFCLAFAGFLRMGKFTYNKVESNFSSWNLTQRSVSLLGN